jgi:hypothetical protein
VDLNYSHLSAAEQQPSARALLQTVHHLYGKHFGRWFAITAPASVLASIVFLLCNDKATAILNSLPRGVEMLNHPWEMAESALLRLCGFFYSWLMACFVLGAIATVFKNVQSEYPEQAWIGDSYEAARENLRSLFTVAALTFAAAWAGTIAASLVGAAAGILGGPKHYLATAYIAGGAGYVLLLGALSWFGMAIPLVLWDGLAGGAALKRSVRLSDGHEAYLLLLTLESVAASYLTFLAVRYMAATLLTWYPLNWEWTSWLVTSIAILASAAVEPPMFIGFSLLAYQVSETHRDSVAVRVPPSLGDDRLNA